MWRRFQHWRWKRRLRNRVDVGYAPFSSLAIMMFIDAARAEGRMPLFEVAIVEEKEKDKKERLVHFERITAKDPQAAAVAVASGPAYQAITDKADPDRMKVQVRPFV